MTLEAQTEEPSTPPRYLDGAKGWVRNVQDAVLHPIPLWGAVVAAVVVVAVAVLGMWRSSGDSNDGTRRWEAGGTARETASFRDLVKPSGPGLFSPLLIYLGLADRPGPIIKTQMDWSRPHIAVYSVPAPVHPDHHPTLRDLGDQAQAHAIDFLAKDSGTKGKSWPQLEEALGGKEDSKPGEKDPFRFDRSLVATVAKGTDWNPGDRMVWTRVFVQPINFSFAGYTVASTENETVKVSSVEDTNTQKLSTELGVAIPVIEGSKASMSGSNEHTVKRTSDVDAQFEKLGIDIMPNFLRVIRESDAEGGDVVGNTLVSLSVLTDPTIIQRRYPYEADKRAMGDDVVLQVTGIHLEDENGDELDKDHASITIMPQVPVPHCALRVRIWMLYEERQISKGAEYYEESRQTVSFLRDADTPRDVDFISPDDVSPAVWSIQVVDNDKPSTKATEATKVTEVLGAHIKNGNAASPPRELVFTDYGQASKLAHWLRNNKDHQIRKLAFDYDGTHSLVPVKNTKDVCVPMGYDPASRRIYQPDIHVN